MSESKMRLVVLNPHTNQCGKMVFNWIFHYPQHNKYTYLWETGLKENKDIAFLVDGTQSSFYQTPIFSKTIGRIPQLMKAFVNIEFWIWKKLNPLSKKCRVYKNINDLNQHKDVIFAFGFTSSNSEIRNYQGLTLIHLSHYHLNTEKIADLLETLKNGVIVSEGEMINNPYFLHYFPNFKNKTYLLPFTFYPGRFKNIVPFKQRINKCFASGPMSIPSDPSYVSFFGKSVALNPMREIMYLNKEDIKNYIASYIYPHDFAVKGMKQILPNDDLLTRFAKKYLPSWILTSILHYKLPYFSFDIVQKYNEYTMFSSPEERTGLPSMKLLEGILCGSVLVGIDDPMYLKIGFIDGVNYIAYKDQDLEDLKKKIDYYQSHLEDLEKIALNGFNFVSENFTPEKVFNIFWSDMESLLQSYNSGNLILTCSFVK